MHMIISYTNMAPMLYDYRMLFSYHTMTQPVICDWIAVLDWSVRMRSHRELTIGLFLGVKKQLIAAHAHFSKKNPSDCGKKFLGFQKSWQKILQKLNEPPTAKKKTYFCYVLLCPALHSSGLYTACHIAYVPFSLDYLLYIKHIWRQLSMSGSDQHESLSYFGQCVHFILIII